MNDNNGLNLPETPGTTTQPGNQQPMQTPIQPNKQQPVQTPIQPNQQQTVINPTVTNNNIPEPLINPNLDVKLEQGNNEFIQNETPIVAPSNQNNQQDAAMDADAFFSNKKLIIIIGVVIVILIIFLPNISQFLSKIFS